MSTIARRQRNHFDAWGIALENLKTIPRVSYPTRCAWCNGSLPPPSPQWRNLTGRRFCDDACKAKHRHQLNRDLRAAELADAAREEALCQC